MQPQHTQQATRAPLALALSLALTSALTFALALILAPAEARAQDSKEVVEYDFDEDVIDGSTKSPEELYINSLKNKKISNLITIRKDFKQEIVKSAEGI